MTRLIPTRDRALATRYPSNQAAWNMVKRVKCMAYPSRVMFNERPVWILRAYRPTRLGGPLWAGPWYVREVAE